MSIRTNKALNRYWHTVVDLISDGVMIVEPSGIIAAVNRAFSEITGFSQEDVVGRSCRVMRCNICRHMLEREGGVWCSLFTQSEDDSPRRCVIHKKDGTPVHALKNAALLRDDQGDVIGAVETITDITQLVEKDDQLEEYRQELRARDGYHGIIGASAPMQRVFALIENAAHSEAPVIIQGDSGTGKELVSRAIHDVGGRRDRPFVKINCASLTESLLESELFGHVRGAFTGAIRDRVGRFEEASGGDLFLDEIGDLPLSTQTKLLRVLEEKVIERVGDNRPIPADVRIISATNRDLAELVKVGAFREDFYFRINVVPIHLPPLHSRREDIPLLAEAFFRQLRLKSGKPIDGVSKAAMDLLMRYAWPGNVRELRSAFEYAFVTCQAGSIQPEHLPDTIQPGEPQPAGSTPTLVVRPPVIRTAANLDLREIERQELIEALEQTGGNQTHAARLLGVSRVTVWNRMKRHGIRAERKVKTVR